MWCKRIYSWFWEIVLFKPDGDKINQLVIYENNKYKVSFFFGINKYVL